MRNVKILATLIALVICSCNKDKTQFYNLGIEVVPDNSGSLSVARDTLIEKNEEVELVAYSNEAFVFSHWEGSINSAINPLRFSMTKDESLIANFLKRKYALNISKKGNGQVSESIVKSKTDYEAGTNVQLIATPDEGWMFDKWIGDLSSEEDTLEVLMTKETNLTAIFLEVETYCVPTSLIGYSQKENGDSLKYLDYEFEYEGRFLKEYSKKIDQLKTNEFPYSSITVFLNYSNDDLISVDQHFEFEIRQQYSFSWENKKLSELDVLHTQPSGNQQFTSDKIEYNSECGLKYFEGKNVSNYGGNVDTSYYYVDYIYENNCFTYSADLSNEKISYENLPSIFTDISGLNGLVGFSYDYLFSEGGIIPGSNFSSLRLNKIESEVYRDGNVVIDEEFYRYYDHLEENKYPQYFTREGVNHNTGDPENESFVVTYKCVEKNNR